MSLPKVQSGVVEVLATTTSDWTTRLDKMYEKMQTENPYLATYIQRAALRFKEEYGDMAGLRAARVLLGLYSLLDNQAGADDLKALLEGKL